jgi:hypothetical protein
MVWQQGAMRALSEEAAHTDYNPDDHDIPHEDHFAHAPGKICQACGGTIELGQDARRRGQADWVHDVCPPFPADRG